MSSSPEKTDVKKNETNRNIHQNQIKIQMLPCITQMADFAGCVFCIYIYIY